MSSYLYIGLLSWVFSLPERKDFCLLCLLPQHLEIAVLPGLWEWGFAWPGRVLELPLGWVPGAAHPMGNTGKIRGICTSVFPKDALGLKFQPCNFFFMVFFLTLKWMKTESVQTTIIISQWWKWAQWESTLAAKIVMHEEGSGFGCWGTALVLRPPPEAGAVCHALSLQTAGAQQATTVLL